MRHADLIIHNASQLVTCASAGVPKRGEAMQEVGLIKGGAVAVANGSIVGVGTSDTIRREFEATDEIDAEGGVVCPGFVDPHTHIVFAGDRLNEFELKIKGAEYLEILASGGGIISTVKQTRKASQEDLVEQAGKRLDKMLACGTTTCEIKTGYGLDTATELKMLAVTESLNFVHDIEFVPTFLAAHAIPPEFKQEPDKYVDLICESMLSSAWDWFVGSSFYQRTPFFCDVFCEQGSFTLAQSKRILESARSLGFWLKAHVDEFNNLGGSLMAIEMGAASIDHLDAISEDEIAMLAAAKTVGIVTPTVNFNFGSAHFADARRMVDAGCAIALSTDYNPGSAPCPSQPFSMAVACRYQRLLPSEAFNAVTINAAHAIGLGHTHGSIEVGKAADILVLACQDHRQVANEFGGNLVTTVLKGGRVVRSELHN